jgi:hypothetical protein
MFTWTTPVQIFGSAFQAMAYASLPAAASAAGQIYAITDFGSPYVLVQSNGSSWKQITEFNCAWDSLPSATTFAGFVGYSSISGLGNFRIESRLIDATYKWRPLLGTSLNIITFNDDAGTTIGPINPANETSILTGPVLPADFLQVKDRFAFLFFVSRTSPLNPGGKVGVRMGTSDTVTSNPTLVRAYQASTSAYGFILFFSFLSSDTKCRFQPLSFSGFGATTSAPTTATLSSLAANAQKTFLTVQPGDTSETVTINHASLRLEIGV